jgi:two-component system chemotaxis sensor kinase CheA
MTMMDDEVISEFLIESHENLDTLDREFVALEGEPNNRARIATIFRAVHTIKGTSGFLSLGKLEALTHAGESLLGRLRDGSLGLTPEITSALLAMVDAVRITLGNVERTGGEGDADHGALIERLRRLVAAATPAQQARPAPPPPRPPTAAPAPPVAPPLAATVPPPRGPARPRPASAPPEPSARGEIAPPSRPPGSPSEPPGDGASNAEARGSAVAESAVRVNVGLLDKLMNLVGELVLARNQILQVGAGSTDPAFVGASQRLNLLTTELQEGVMKTRMQPIGNVWNKLPRLVRDLALACGKQVTVELEGNETELDRTIIEAIKDPLTHLVRNAIDHGIEAPEARRAAGKPEAGRLRLRAFHEGGQVNIEISDDGAGLDPDAIRAKAVERGLVSAERAARLGPGEVVNFIFLPGFSTARAVTNVSGRGVGMDVVKTNIERIGGTVDLRTRRGEGTALRIKIPLTLAIIPALIVSSGGDRYAIPQVNLLELVRAEGATAAVAWVQGAPVYKLRGNLLPLVFLDRALGLPPAAPGGGAEDALNIVVLQADGRQFGLVVDGVNDTEEIVVKPLGKELKGVTVFAGATIMGDGHVALILDVVGLAQRAGVVSAGRDRTRADKAPAAAAEGGELEALLLFRVGGARLALPLSMVARLEEFPRERVERAGRRRVVQYRGEILPLVDLASYVEGGREAGEAVDAEADAATLKVIVYSAEGKSIGLAVERILDVVEERVVVKRGVAQKGVLGAAVVQGRVTDMLDVQGVIRAADPTFFERRPAP